MPGAFAEIRKVVRVTFDPAATNTIHRLLKAATRTKAVDAGIPEAFNLENQQVDSNGLEQNQLQFHELIGLAQQVIAFRDDPFKLATELLSYVSSQLQTIAQLQGLVATLAPEPRLPSSPSIRLLAICQFSQSGVQIHVDNGPTMVAYAEILESLVTSQTPFNSQVYSSILLQFVRRLQKPETWSSQLLSLYALLLVSEARRSDSDLIALDLFSESLESVEQYRDNCDVDATVDVLYRILTEAAKNQLDATECLQAFVLLQPIRSKMRELTLVECESLLLQLLSQPNVEHNELLTAAQWFRRLAQHDENRVFANLLLNGCTVSRKRSQRQMAAELGPLLENAMESRVEVHRIRYLLSAFERGEIADSSTFLRSVERLTDFKQVETLSTHRVLTVQAINQVDRLRLGESNQLVSPELLQTRLNHWHELNAIHRGFTSRLISAKRGPFREPPDLVQFAIDVGSEKSVRYINAKDANLFPGKGFFITRLQLAKCFATDESDNAPGKNRFNVYKKAWPGLAEAMDHFDDAEFVFLRGCLLISCKRRDYLLPSGIGEHYSLVVFNDHFRNPFQEVAYLVPNEGVAKLLLGTQIPYCDFVGFDQRRPDLNDQIQSPQGFLQHPLISERAIDVGGVSAILSGFEDHLVRIGQRVGLQQLRKRTEELVRHTEDHNRVVLEWEQQSHRYHISSIGQQRMFELSSIGKRLEAELRRLNQQSAELLGQVEGAIWNLVDKYTNLHKLFCIAHAYWHRGYTAGRMVTTNHIDESIEDDGISNESLPEQNQLRLQENSETVTNRNSIRMLVQAYEWHAMRESPNSKKEDFPVLVLCDALALGDQPEMNLMIDTYDMSVAIDGQRVQLSQGRMSGDDELYWFNTIFPKIQDSAGSIRDLRFYPRASLGMQN